MGVELGVVGGSYERGRREEWAEVRMGGSVVAGLALMSLSLVSVK